MTASVADYRPRSPSRRRRAGRPRKARLPRGGRLASGQRGLPSPAPGAPAQRPRAVAWMSHWETGPTPVRLPRAGAAAPLGPTPWVVAPVGRSNPSLPNVVSPAGPGPRVPGPEGSPGGAASSGNTGVVLGKPWCVPPYWELFCHCNNGHRAKHVIAGLNARSAEGSGRLPTSSPVLATRSLSGPPPEPGSVPQTRRTPHQVPDVPLPDRDGCFSVLASLARSGHRRR